MKILGTQYEDQSPGVNGGRSGVNRKTIITTNNNLVIYYC